MGNPIHTEPDCEMLHRSKQPVSPHRVPVGLPPASLLKVLPLTGAAFFILLTCFSAHTVRAQSAPAAQVAPAAKPESNPSTRRHRTRSHPGKTAAAAPAVPAAPPAPPKPDWPIDQPPNPAKVTWDSQGLAIQASNSSLQQILHEVATDTGVKIQGLNKDERIFGTYGPGPAREVLSSLLDGSGYNVLMVGGGQGNDPPRQVILSKSAAGTPQPVNAGQALRNNATEEDNDVEEQPQEPEPTPPPMPIRNPFPMPPRAPQQIQQEMIMRQQQIEQQQEQQREQQQQNNPQ